MSRTAALLGRLEDTSDWLSPIVVKEVRQLVRGREFMYSFSASLVAGLAAAFFGAADALRGSGTSGNGTFVALMACLTFLGLAVVPLGAFSALRNERMEQTLELITLTALSPRRIVIGKLLAQGVKLATLFAGMAPFIAMSFLLGGIDFVTILLALLVLFMWSLWAIAACLFLSCLLKSRAMSALVFGGAAIVLFLVFSLGRMFFLFAGRGMGPAGYVMGSGGAGLPWRELGIMTTCCLASMVNLILLAENRLSLATDNRVTALRVGFLVQFLIATAWTLTFLNDTPGAQLNAVRTLGVAAGVHLALVAMFTVTESMFLSRRVLRQVTAPPRWSWLLAMFRPGGGRAAIYVLVQMAVLLGVTWFLDPAAMMFRWMLAMCGYVLFFTGVPTLLFRVLRPTSSATLQLRVALFVLLPVSMLLPDIVHYMVWRPELVDLSFGSRHLINPLRTLAQWTLVESRHWFAIPTMLGLTGLVAYLGLMLRGLTAQPADDPQDAVAAAGEPDSAKALY